MKPIQKLLVLWMIILYAHPAGAQIQGTSKAQFFRHSSQRVVAKATELEKAFGARPGTTVKLQFENFDFKGLITASVKKYENLHNVLIRSASSENMLFSISKIVNEDKSIYYTGRIIDNEYADGYELIREDDGNYMLIKISTEKLLQDN